MVSLRTRLVLAVTAVALTALLAADIATYSSLRTFLYNRVDQALIAQAALFENQPQGGVAVGQPNPVDGQQRFYPPHLTSSGYYFEVRSPDGSVRFPANPSPVYVDGKAYSPKLPAHISDFEMTTAGNDPGVFFNAASTKTGGPEFRVLAVQRSDDDVVILATSLAETNSTLHGLLVIELTVTALALLAAVILSLWVVRVGLHPLRDIEATADAIAAGEMDQRVPGENERTEVGRLARALNVMLSRIQSAFEQRDETEAELRTSEERLRRFVADASHELRTPLAAVSAYAELFERGAKEHPEDLGRVLTGIRSETSRMSTLVEDLFLLARLDEGRPLRSEPVDLVALARESVHTANTVGPQWPVTLSADKPVEIWGDSDRLRQVVDNLLGNVRAHTPAGTSTTVSVQGEGDEAVLSVADEGEGFGDTPVDKIFERFYRADPSRSRAHGGTGLGLSIVQAIVVAHGGRVEAANGPDGGAVITVHLPLRKTSTTLVTSQV
jgi:two-component system, OmpR family, sensor kinase